MQLFLFFFSCQCHSSVPTLKRKSLNALPVFFMFLRYSDEGAPGALLRLAVGYHFPDCLSTGIRITLKWRFLSLQRSNYRVCTMRDHFNVVASLKDGQNTRADTHQRMSHVRIALRSQAKPSEGVIDCRVKATRDND